MIRALRGPLGQLLSGARALSRLPHWPRLGVAFGFGALSAMALAPYYLLPFLVVGLSGLVLLLDGCREARRPLRAAFLTGWAFGFGYFLLGMYWLAFAFLVQADQFGWMIPIAVPAFTGFLGVFIALPCLLAALLFRRGWTGLGRIGALVVLLAAFEWLRGTILTGLPWNLFGQSFAGSALLAQPVAVIGPYGLSLLVMLMAALPGAAIPAGAKARWPLTMAAGLFLAVLAFGSARLALNPPQLREDVRLVIAQPNVPQRDKVDPVLRDAHFERLVAMTAEATEGPGMTYAVWPENAYPWLAETPGAGRYFADTLGEETVLVTGTIRTYGPRDDLDFANSVVVFGQTEAGDKPLLATYDKHHLVPFGEYLPLAGLLKAVGLSQLAPVEDGFTPGPGPQTLPIGPAAFAPLICYEDVFPRQLYPHDARPDWLAVVTNDAWFGDGAGPRQHLDIGRMRAIESGLPLARSANTGISALIDPHGRILTRLNLYTSGTIVHSLPLPAARTLYDRWGEALFVLLVTIVTVASGSRVVARLS